MDTTEQDRTIPSDAENSELREQINRLNAELKDQQDEHEKLRKYMRQLTAYVEEHKKPNALDVKQQENINQAIEELKEISRHLEKAISSILNGAVKMETLLKAYMFAEKAKLEKEVTGILESCNVQDIASQRIVKILELLGDKDAIAKKERQASKSGGLESGPQLPGAAMSQEEIDKLLQG